MGETFLNYYKTKVKTEWKLAFFSVLVFGLIAHLYKFTNTLLIHDSLFSVYSTLENTVNGRWFLQLAGLPSSYFDLPWINGILSLFYLGLTAAVITDIFEMKNRLLIILSSALLVTFPSMTNTFFFEFTADAYMLSMLLAALSVRLCIMRENRRRLFVWAIVCVCFSCGIYQAYLSFALILALCYFMWELLRNRFECRTYGVWILREIIVFFVGVLLYYIIWKLLMLLPHDITESSYQGMGDAFGFSFGSVVDAALKTAREMGKLFLGQNVLEHGWTVYAVLNLVFLAGTLFFIVCAVLRSGLYKRTGFLALFILCICAIPFAACIFFFVSPGVFYHPLMLESMCVVYIFSLLLLEEYFPPKQSSIICLLFVLLIGKNILNANICYQQMNLCMERSRNMATEILTRVHELDDGGIKRIVFVYSDDPAMMKKYPERLSEIAYSGNQLRSHLLYSNTYAYLYLSEIMGCEYEEVGYEGIDELEGTWVTDMMNPWPLDSSVIRMGNTAIIRLPEEVASYG